MQTWEKEIVSCNYITVGAGIRATFAFATAVVSLEKEKERNGAGGPRPKLDHGTSLQYTKDGESILGPWHIKKNIKGAMATPTKLLRGIVIVKNVPQKQKRPQQRIISIKSFPKRTQQP